MQSGFARAPPTGSHEEGFADRHSPRPVIIAMAVYGKLSERMLSVVRNQKLLFGHFF